MWKALPATPALTAGAALALAQGQNTSSSSQIRLPVRAQEALSSWADGSGSSAEWVLIIATLAVAWHGETSVVAFIEMDTVLED